jgi:transcriptional regulator GlxA family with amidase domain
VDGALGDENYQAIVIPSIHYDGEKEFLDFLSSQETLYAWIRTQEKKQCVLAATCTGTFILANAGVLNNRTITTTWWLSGLFKHLYPQLALQEERILIEDNRIITGGAANSYINLAFHLAEKFAGISIASQCSRLMLIDSKQSSQAAFSNLQGRWKHQDDMVSNAQRWIDKHHHQELSLKDIAGYISTTQRTLSRRFNAAIGMSPLAYLQLVRVDAAKRLLENTGLNLEAIVEKIGYQDVSSFRRLFSRTTHLTPQEYRRQFSHS